MHVWARGRLAGRACLVAGTARAKAVEWEQDAVGGRLRRNVTLWCEVGSSSNRTGEARISQASEVTWGWSAVLKVTGSCRWP